MRRKIIVSRNPCNLTIDEQYPASFVYSFGEAIVLGIYKNDEQRMASLFHEVGHILVAGDYEGQFEYEAEAWKRGIKLAMEYDISFSGETMMWISKQMSTYKHGDV
jgi:hypothetical protein